MQRSAMIVRSNNVEPVCCNTIGITPAIALLHGIYDIYESDAGKCNMSGDTNGEQFDVTVIHSESHLHNVPFTRYLGELIDKGYLQRVVWSSGYICTICK
jgi:hypothetical protein